MTRGKAKKKLFHQKLSAIYLQISLALAKKEKDYILDQLSLLVAGNIGLDRSLEIISGQLRTPVLKKQLMDASRMIRDGKPLWIVLEQSQLFSEQTISLIRLGEESGNLVENLKTITEQERRAREISGKIQSALTYPIMVLLLALIIGVGIAWYILPKLATVFSSLKIELPFFTQILVKFGNLISEYGSILLPSFFIGGFLLIYLLFFYKHTRVVGEKILFSLPGFNTFITEMEMSHFGYVMSNSLSHGFPIPLILNLLSSTTRWHRYKKMYSHMCRWIEDGGTFESFFHANLQYKKIFPATLQEMIVVSEQSANLQVIFGQIYESLDNKSTRSANTLITIMEPVMLVMVWLVVLFIAFSIILPVYSLIGGIEKAQQPFSRPAARKNVSVPTNTVKEMVIETAPKVTERETTEEAPVSEQTHKPPFVTILSTPTNYLNVRNAPSLGSTLLLRVAPGETYGYLGQENGWIHIALPNNIDGWVAQHYVSITE